MGNPVKHWQKIWTSQKKICKNKNKMWKKMFTIMRKIHIKNHSRATPTR